MRPFLKWAGNKYRLIDKITGLLPCGERLIEPFVGAGAVFLNTDFSTFLLTDVNRDLIALYQILQKEGADFIDYCRRYFVPRNNERTAYFNLRSTFNALDPDKNAWERAALFLYLNRHGYNGLCRYNARGRFNVPFGQYVRPYFPEAEMKYFYQKARKAVFRVQDFRTTMMEAVEGDVVYCDPPYAPMSETANFTGYSMDGFNMRDQADLAELARELSCKNIPVLISNHDNDFTQKAYIFAQVKPSFPVQRYISCQGGNRRSVSEILALFR